jgi:hypothetical protein
MSLLVIDARDLYGLPLDRFVPERGALARELRKEGRREQAAEVAGLRKPSVAAWAVNQLVRTQSHPVTALFDAGDALQHAHSQLLAGRGDGAALRNAHTREREAVSELVEKARGLLSSEGHGLAQATMDRVSETLHAAALDAEAREQVKEGCLYREFRHVGLGASEALSMPNSTSGRSRSRAPGKTAARARSTGSGGVAPTRERGDRERTKRLGAARKAEADARRVADRAGRDLLVAERRRDRASESLREAEAAVAAAREQAEKASLAHRNAQKALAHL